MSDTAVERSTRKQLLGRMLAAVGVLSLPLALGSAVGFYVADRGVRWVPTMLGLILIACVFGLLSIVVGQTLSGAALRQTDRGLRLKKRVALVLALASLGAILRLGVYWVEQPSPLTELQPVDFHQAFNIDSKLYIEHSAALQRLMVRVASEASLQPGGDVLDADTERRLLEHWRAFYDHAFSLDRIRRYYEDWYRFDASRAQRGYHVKSFLLSYACELALYEYSTRAAQLIVSNENAVKFLDSPHPGHGLPAGTLSFIRQELNGSRDIARVEAGESYLSWLDTGLGVREDLASYGIEWLWTRIEDHLFRLEIRSSRDLARLGVGGDLQVFKRAVRRAWYPAQKSVAESLGDTRVRRIGWYLITPEQQTQMNDELEPGDIMFTRKNWYLSNVGLPGFWPHALLYVGSVDKLTRYFDVPEVRELVSELARRPLSLPEFLELEWPVLWQQYVLGHAGEDYRVIEAVGEGVIFNTLGAASGDYMAAIRPLLDKRAKAQALIEAFKHLGKPYDFDFDFATDHRLVCTELVWRAYRPALRKQGLELPLITVAGRRTLPANEIVKIFSATQAAADTQFEFVYFIDAREKERRAVVSTREEFVRTPNRTKWDVLLE